MKILGRIRKRTKADNGDAVMVLGIMLILVTLVVGAMLLDITKAFQMKSSYIEAAQKATQSAIRYQNSEGHLEDKAVAEALRVYETISRPSVIKEGSMSFCATNVKPTRNIPIAIILTGGSSSDLLITVDSNKISSSDTVENILNKISYNPDDIKNGEYTGIEIQLTESTPNIILPSASRILTGGSDNGESIKCQNLGIRTKAEIYSGEDGKFN